MKQFIWVFSFLIGCSNVTDADSPPYSEQFEKVDQLFSAWDKESTPGCGLGIIKDGELIYSRGYGMANLEKGEKITPKSVFRIGSTSKQFTAMCIALLEEQGKLSLEDDIRKYVPELPVYDPPIKIKHLVHHTSGLKGYQQYIPVETATEADVLDLLKWHGASLNHPTGYGFRYTNTGYILMGVIVRRVSGKTLRQFAEEQIFKPLGMNATFFNDNTSEDHTITHFAQGYNQVGMRDFYPIKIISDLVGDGAILTTIEDMYKWDQNFYANTLGKGKQSLIDRVYAKGKLDNGEDVNYGFGLFVEEYKGKQSIWHGGRFLGFSADIFRLPNQNFSVICLFNIKDKSPWQLTKEVADIFVK